MKLQDYFLGALLVKARGRARGGLVAVGEESVRPTVRPTARPPVRTWAFLVWKLRFGEWKVSAEPVVIGLGVSLNP